MTTNTNSKKSTRKKTQKTSKRMFNIRQKMADMTQQEKSKMYAFLTRESQFSKTTIRELMYLRSDTRRTPNFYILKAFAAYFKCTIEELENK